MDNIETAKADTCSICIEDCKDPIDRSPCNHRFCKSCLETWYQHDLHHSCPLCRDGHKSDTAVEFSDESIIMIEIVEQFLVANRWLEAVENPVNVTNWCTDLSPHGNHQAGSLDGMSDVNLVQPLDSRPWLALQSFNIEFTNYRN